MHEGCGFYCNEAPDLVASALNCLRCEQRIETSGKQARVDGRAG